MDKRSVRHHLFMVHCTEAITLSRCISSIGHKRIGHSGWQQSLTQAHSITILLAVFSPLFFNRDIMDNRVKFYCWLIALLKRRRLTFEEIADEWRNASCNPFKEELQLRTFHRYRDAIQSQFGQSVECDKSDGYKYYIKRDPVEDNDVTEWMLSSLRIASLGGS